MEIQNTNKSLHSDLIIIPHGKTHLIINPEDILYLEAKRQYTIIHLKEQQVVVTYNLKKISQKLPNNFIRIHHSYSVNIFQTEQLNHTKGIKLFNKTILPISRRKKRFVIEKIKTLTLI